MCLSLSTIKRGKSKELFPHAKHRLLTTDSNISDSHISCSNTGFWQELVQSAAFNSSSEDFQEKSAYNCVHTLIYQPHMSSRYTWTKVFTSHSNMFQIIGRSGINTCFVVLPNIPIYSMFLCTQRWCLYIDVVVFVFVIVFANCL